MCTSVKGVPGAETKGQLFPTWATKALQGCMPCSAAEGTGGRRRCVVGALGAKLFIPNRKLLQIAVLYNQMEKTLCSERVHVIR